MGDATTTTTTTTTGANAKTRSNAGRFSVVRAVCEGVNTALRACEEHLNDVNERYSFELNPEYRIKMKKRYVNSRECDDEVDVARGGRMRCARVYE
jgi:hypothetical protein